MWSLNIESEVKPEHSQLWLNPQPFPPKKEKKNILLQKYFSIYWKNIDHFNFYYLIGHYSWKSFIRMCSMYV